MKIDYKTAGEGMSRQSEIISRKGRDGAVFIGEFMHDKCHYFTVIAANAIGASKVAVFYLEGSKRVIHSVVMLGDERVLDALGCRPVVEVQATYDAMNNMTGAYFAQGRCSYQVIELTDFDPGEYYIEPLSDLSAITERITDWIDQFRPIR